MGSSSFFIILSTLYISLLPVLVRGNGCLTGGINGERLCCEGKDVTCFANGYQSYYRSCYCDSACTYSQDCCGDYHQTCEGKNLSRSMRGAGDRTFAPASIAPGFMLYSFQSQGLEA